MFEKAWIEASPPLELDFNRIILPPPKRFFFSVNWRERYIFEFVLPNPESLLRQRIKRAELGTHHVDEAVNLERIERQFSVYLQIARYLHQQGISIYIREGKDGILLQIID